MVLIYRLDASDITTMFTDVAKTTQVTDGGAVYTWAPKAGSVTTDAIQATSANRPTYRANYASTGKPGLEFDGSNDTMTIAHSTGWNTTTIVEILAVVYCDTTSAGVYRGIITKMVSGGWNDGWMVSQNLGLFQFGSPSYAQFSETERLGRWVLLYGRAGTSQPSTFGAWAEAPATLFTPTMNAGATTTPQTNTGSVQICAATGGSYLFDGAIGEIQVYTGGETAATMATAISAIMTRWGLSTTMTFSSGGGLLLPRAQNGGYAA